MIIRYAIGDVVIVRDGPNESLATITAIELFVTEHNGLRLWYYTSLSNVSISPERILRKAMP